MRLTPCRTAYPCDGRTVGSRRRASFQIYDQVRQKHGDLVRSQGAVAGIIGEASEAQTSYLEPHRMFRKAGEKRSEAMAHQDIGQIYSDAGDYERMLSYVDQAQEICNDDPSIALSVNNNRGEAYRALRRWADAEKAFAAPLANPRNTDLAERLWARQTIT